MGTKTVIELDGFFWSPALPVSDLVPSVPNKAQDNDQPVEELDVEPAEAGADNPRLNEQNDQRADRATRTPVIVHGIGTPLRG